MKPEYKVIADIIIKNNKDLDLDFNIDTLVNEIKLLLE